LLILCKASLVQSVVGESPEIVVDLIWAFLGVLDHHIPHLAERGPAGIFVHTDASCRAVRLSSASHSPECLCTAREDMPHWISECFDRLDFAEGHHEIGAAHILRLPNRVVAAIVHTMNVTIATINNIKAMQQPQQTGLIFNASVWFGRLHELNATNS